MTDVLTSLSTNLIDTAAATPYAAVAFRWHTKFKYMSERPVTNGVAGTIIKKSMWDKISPQNQQIIQDISKIYFKKLVDFARTSNHQAIATLKKAGIQTMSSDSSQQLKLTLEAAKKARESLVGELYSQALLDQTLSYIAEYRAQHPSEQ